MAGAGKRRERRYRQLEPAQFSLRQFHGEPRHSDLSRHRRAARAGPAAQTMEAAGWPRHVHPALRHGRTLGLLRDRGAGRRRAASGTPRVRGDLPGHRGPRHDGSLGRRRSEETPIRVADRFALFNSHELLAPGDQRALDPGSAFGGDHRAEYDQPRAQHGFYFQLSLRIQRPLQRR